MSVLGNVCSVKKVLFLFLPLAVGGTTWLIQPQPTTAQVIPDATLGAEGSTLIPNQVVRGQLADVIEGGAARGDNLFHSFATFNVNEGQAIYFGSPAAIANIFSRVTERNPSNILGLLGVDGPANLYFLNPYGIVFGSNASLDIDGSLTVSAADDFAFEDNSKFGATLPNSLPLLTVTAPLGIQPGPSPSQDSIITHQGALSTGQNLTLLADTLKLEGLLSAAQDLTLRGTTVQIRDSQSLPFVATAGNNLLVRGDHTVDIFALSYPESGLFAGGNIILRSANPVGGDARYYSGGNYRIEQLDNRLGQLQSPHDPVIRAAGNVSFESYAGASLHILAGGSVTIPGDISITATETASNSLQEQILLSNGSVVDIDGSVEPTLDIRAGTTGFGVSGIAGSFTGVPAVLNATDNITATATSADINIGGQITIFNFTDGGTVLLTNRFEPNALAAPNGIVVGAIDAQDDFGGGDVFIDSRSDITLNQTVDVSSFDLTAGNGGDVMLLAANDIDFANTTIPIFSYGLLGGNITLESSRRISAAPVTIVWSVSVANTPEIKGGNITIRAPEVNITNGSILGAYTTGQANAGDITIAADHLNIDTSGRVEAVTFGQGNAGNLSIRGFADKRSHTVHIGGDVETGFTAPSGLFNSVGLFDISLSRLVFNLTEGFGDAGNLSIQTEALEVLDGGRISTDITGVGNAGAIDIDATTIDIIGSNPEIAFLSGIFSAVSPLGEGTGGDINIKTSRLQLAEGGFISASTFNIGDAGALNIQADSVDVVGISADGVPSRLRANVDIGGVGQGGDLALNVNRLRISQGGEILSDTEGNGDGGQIEISAQDQILLEDGGRISTTAFSTSTGNSGDILLRAPQIDLIENSEISATTSGQGRAGTVTVRPLAGSSDLRLSLNASELSAATTGQGLGGNVVVDASAVEAANRGRIVTTTTSSAEAGRINLQARDSLSLRGEGSGIFANATAGATGDSGSVKINPLFTPGAVQILDGAGVAVNNQGEGVGGNIQIRAGRLTLDNRAFISAETASNQGGDITIETRDVLLMRNNSFISTTAGTAQTGGDGGNVSIRAPFIVAIAEENSDITANAFAGSGGQVDLTSQGIFGLTFREEQTPLSDITASSELGLSGEVTLNSPDTASLENGLTELPDALINTDTLVASSCIAPTAQGNGRLVLTGADGLPQQPNSASVAEVPTGAIRTFSAPATSDGKPWEIGDAISEPQRLYRLADGRLVLSRSCL